LLSIFWNSPIFNAIAPFGAGVNGFFALSVRRHNRSQQSNKQHRRNQMKFNKWTLGLAALGVVSLASAARADEKLSPVQTALSNTTLSGYVDVAANWRPGTDSGSLGGGAAPVNAANIPASSFSKNDGFSLNAVDLALDKPMDEGPWASGYHVELMLGPDQPLNSSYTSHDGNYAGIRQAYVSLRTPVGNGIDWKVGVFDTIIGYESTSCPLNPNYTRSYGYSIEPTTHTGVLATYKAGEVLSLSAGVANTWGTAGGTLNGTPAYESQKTYMGSITLTAPESFGALKGATLTLGAINGVDRSIAAGGPGSQTSWYAGLVLPTPSNKVKLGAAFDYRTFNNRGGANSSDDSIWVAGLYATISPTDKLSFNFRGEFVDATQIGSSIVAPVSPNPLNGFYAGHYAGEVTATVQYQLWANVLSRLEFRWDHVDTDAFGVASGSTIVTGAVPYKRNDFLIALNLVYQF
jgi:hypothetical protein